MPYTLKIVDDVVNQLAETTLPGNTVMFVGTSVKQPIGQDLVVGTPTQLAKVFGKYPADPSTLVNGNLSDSQKVKVIDQLNRNIPYNADLLKSLFVKGTEPTLIAIRVGEYGFSSITLNENQLINAVTDPYNRQTKPGTPLPSIKFEAVEGGDEYNYFAIKIEADANGVANKLIVKYDTPVSVGYSSLATIEDSLIQTPYEIDIDGLSVDEIASSFNSPLNPFSSYIQATVSYIEITKDKIVYNKGDKYITLGNMDEGAFRFKNMKQFTLESELMGSTFVQGQQKFVLPMSVKKDETGVEKTMKEPMLTVLTTFNTSGDTKSQAFKDANKIIPPSTMPYVANVYGFAYIPDHNMFWDKDLSKMELASVYVDGDVETTIPAAKITTSKDNGKFEIFISDSVVDGMPEPILNTFETDGTTPKTNTITLELEAPTTGETGFVANQYTGFSIAYVNDRGEYALSEKEKFADVTGKVLAVDFALDAGNKFKVSEDIKKIFVIGYAMAGASEVPTVLKSINMNFGGTAGDQPLWTPAETTVRVDATATTSEVLGTKNVSALAKENLKLVFKFVPKIFEVDDTSKLNGTWNTYWANGNQVITGDVIPENFTLDCKFKYIHTLREGTDYTILSAGRNPGDETDTISFLLRPESNDQFASIESGIFTLKYEVTPSLPSRTTAYTYLKGGVEENYLSDEKYLELCLEKLRYYAPKYRPTHIYICGMSTDFSKEGNDPTTGTYKSIPLNSITQIGELVDEFNTVFPCSLHMESKRNYIVNTIDKDINTKVKNFLNEHVSPTADDFNAVVLRSAYNSPNLRISAGLLHINNTTTVSSRTVPYKMPIMASLISLRNSLLQDFNYERTSLKFPELPSAVSSLIQGEELYTELQFFGFEMYSLIHTSRGASVVRAITNPTCVLQSNDTAQGRVYQEVDDAIKKIVQVAFRYIELNLMGTIGLPKEEIDAHTNQIQVEVTDTFKPSNMLKSVNISLTFANKYNMLRGIGDLTIDAVFYPTLRSVNATAKLTVQQ